MDQHTAILEQSEANDLIVKVQFWIVNNVVLVSDQIRVLGAR